MITSQCEMCGKEITRAGSTPGRTCSRACAAALRRTWKPVTREWLWQKYVEEGLGTTRIGRLVGRDQKRVYEWLVEFGIPMREKWRGNVPPSKPYHDAEWLKAEYAKGGNCYTIAAACGGAPNTVHKYLVKFGIEARTSVASARAAGKTHGSKGEKNGMFGRKGARSTNWKGGVTPDRQAFYQTPEWAAACSEVWRRDDATCRRCGVRKSSEDQEYCVHHVVSFAVKALRAEPSNLVLLCVKCHRWVHSRKNVARDFIADNPRRFRAPPG